MKSIVFLLPAVLLASTCLTKTSRAEAPAGLRAGDPIGVFYVTKVAGADDDGVPAGDSVCYRCRYGSRPMALVFTRSDADHVKPLVETLNQFASDHADDKFGTLVVLLGDNEKALTDEAKVIAASTSTTMTPVVVPQDFRTGPLSYRLDPDAETTIVMARDGQVEKVISGATQSIKTTDLVGQMETMIEL